MVVPVKFWGQELYSNRSSHLALSMEVSTLRVSLRDSFDRDVHEVNVEGAEADEVFVVGVDERRSDVC